MNWTAVSVVRFGTEEFIETEKIARAFWLRFFILVPNILLAVLASNFWFPPLAGWLKLPAESFWLVILHFVATAIWMHVQFGLQGAKLPREQGFLLMFERLLTLAGIVFLLATDKLSPLSALICYSISPILMLLVGTIYLRRFIFARFSVDVQYVKKILAYSLPLLPFSLVGYFSGSYVDAIFISNFLSTKDLGIYSVATQINGIALQLPTLANSLLIPFFVTLEKENLTEKLNGYFENALPSLTLIWGILCTFAGLVGYFFIPIVFGNEFSAAVMPFWILLASSVAAIPLLCGYAALTHSKSVTYIATITSIIAAFVNISLNYLLIPKFGMEGCAWATFFSYLACTAAFAVLLRSKIEMPVSWVFFAMLPILSGSIAYFYTGNMWIGFLINSILSFFVILIKRRSVATSFDIMRRLVRN